MKLIAHRGNTNGPSRDENNPAYLAATLKQGYDVEVDVWMVKDQFYLGHECPQYSIDPHFFQDPRVWCHAKNFDALDALSNLLFVEHYFWHQEDSFTLTSSGLIWTYPGCATSTSSIIVMPEMLGTDALKSIDRRVFGVCSDYVSQLK